MDPTANLQGLFEEPRDGLRHAITFESRHPDNGTSIRLYWMNKRQAVWFRGVAQTLARNEGITPEAAATKVEKVVVVLLAGKKVAENSPRWLLEGRRRFPILSDHAVAQLPHAGPPLGWITAQIVHMKSTDGETKAKLLELTTDEARAFNHALRWLIDENDCTRAEAWQIVGQTLNRLLGGGDVLPGADAWVRKLAEAVEQAGPVLDRLVKSKDVDEYDLRRWAFTTDKLAVAP